MTFIGTQVITKVPSTIAIAPYHTLENARVIEIGLGMLFMISVEQFVL
jgi:hypothetical protein